MPFLYCLLCSKTIEYGLLYSHHFKAQVDKSFRSLLKQMQDFQIRTLTQILVSHHWGPVYSKLVLFHKGYDLVCSIAFTVFRNLQNFD